MTDNGLLRIGELSKRSGVSPALLRAWERRYGLLRPTRSSGGLRLYSLADLERVDLMQRHLAGGLAAAEAAALAANAQIGEAGPPAAGTAPAAVLSPTAARGELADALERFDEPRAHRILDRLLATATLDTLIVEVILPYLRDLGARWEREEATIAQEHFASAVLRGRLLGVARDWGLGIGPLALLACVPGEHHDLGLIAFGLALRSRGWRVVYLGADAPVDTIADAAEGFQPDLVALHAVARKRVRPVIDELRALAATRWVALGGAAAAHDDLEPAGILALPGDPIAEATRVTTLLQSARPVRGRGRPWGGPPPRRSHAPG